MAIGWWFSLDFRFIDFRPLTIEFGGVNKIYDGLRNIYNLPYKIINSLDNINLTYYEANYRDQNIGKGIIDISNISLSGDLIYNYIVEPILSVSGIIRLRNLTITFSGGSKIYDTTIIPGSTLTYNIINIAKWFNNHIINRGFALFVFAFIFFINMVIFNTINIKCLNK